MQWFVPNSVNVLFLFVSLRFTLNFNQKRPFFSCRFVWKRGTSMCTVAHLCECEWGNYLRFPDSFVWKNFFKIASHSTNKSAPLIPQQEYNSARTNPRCSGVIAHLLHSLFHSQFINIMWVGFVRFALRSLHHFSLKLLLGCHFFFVVICFTTNIQFVSYEWLNEYRMSALSCCIRKSSLEKCVAKNVKIKIVTGKFGRRKWTIDHWVVGILV